MLISALQRVHSLHRAKVRSGLKRRARKAYAHYLEELEQRVLLSAAQSTLIEFASIESNNSPEFAPIVNGTPTSGFPAVGIVGDTRFGDGCSGALISPTHVLTAGHCAAGVEDAQARFTVNGTQYTSSRVFVHPEYNSNSLDNDIAIIQLNRSVVGVDPMSIFRGTPQVGQTLTLVGFGAGGDGNSGHNGDFGTKRVGTTQIDGVTPTLITWSFDNNNESNTAPGDSGGPAFLTVNGQQFVAGVTSGGDRQDAGIGDRSFDTRVDAYAS